MLQSRQRFSPRGLLRPVLAGATLVAIAASPLLAAAVERPFDRSFDAGSIHRIHVENLVGEMTVVGTSGDKIHVSGTVYADPSDGATAAQLADGLKVEFEVSGERLTVRAVYPTGRHSRYYYPRHPTRDADLPWFLSWGNNSSVRYLGERVQVTGHPSSDAAVLYADFRIEVPASVEPSGLAIEVRNQVGLLHSRDVVADQKLDAASGGVEASGGKGRLAVDTGSGDVVVTGHEGSVDADTGSGDVHMQRVRGDKLTADTGSGDVEIVDCQGSIDADTGSGDVTGRNVVVGRRFRADTGSGDVRVAGDFGAVRDLYVDTGSGDVTLTLSAVPSVRLKVSTGSGDIDLDVPNVRIHSLRHRDLVADLGAGDGSGTIDTGSGDVRLRTAD